MTTVVNVGYYCRDPDVHCAGALWQHSMANPYSVLVLHHRYNNRTIACMRCIVSGIQLSKPLFMCIVAHGSWLLASSVTLGIHNDNYQRNYKGTALTTRFVSYTNGGFLKLQRQRVGRSQDNSTQTIDSQD